MSMVLVRRTDPGRRAGGLAAGLRGGSGRVMSASMAFTGGPPFHGVWTISGFPLDYTKAKFSMYGEVP